MKKIYLIGFRGTGFQSLDFPDEVALIRAGHLGIMFDNDEQIILGFHPTVEAVEALGVDVIEWLKARNILAGTLQDDYQVFVRAVELAELGARTTAWRYGIDVSDEEYDFVYHQAYEWYNERKVFAYAFPSDRPMPDRDNCVTFPRRLGLPLLDPIGQIRDCVRVLERDGTQWKPKGN